MSLSTFSYTAAPGRTPVDFSMFEGLAPDRDFTYLGLTPEEIESLTRDDFGLSKRLIQEFPDLTTRAGKPQGWLKSFIVFEAQGRDTTQSFIAQGTGLSCNSVYQHLNKARKAVLKAYGISIEVSGDRVFMVNETTLQERTDRALKAFEKASVAFKRLEVVARSLENLNRPAQLSPSARIMLAAYNDIKQLQAA